MNKSLDNSVFSFDPHNGTINVVTINGTFSIDFWNTSANNIRDSMSIYYAMLILVQWIFIIVSQQRNFKNFTTKVN